MDIEDLNLYFEVKSEMIESSIKYELNMKYYQAIMTSADKPEKVYRTIWKQLFKSKPQTDEELENSFRSWAGKTVKKGGE